MKIKLIFTVLIFSFSLFANAQLIIQSDFSQDLYYDKELKDWEVVDYHEEFTTFNLSEDMTTFQYTENGVTDDYTIISYDFDEETTVLELVIHDNSNIEYFVMIDAINLFLSMTAHLDGFDYMLLFNITDITNE
jgi:hypothetical protein